MMMETIKTKYFAISYEKERIDTDSLAQQIAGDSWFDSSTIIVNCSPDYSSRLTQTLNHKLSYLNSNELYETIDLSMPYPNTSQVWDPVRKEYSSYDTYLRHWVTRNIYANKFLFVGAGTLRGRNFAKLRLALKPFLENEFFRFASLYKQNSSIFRPDYCVEEFDKSTQGPLLFQWENMDNPNRDY